MGEKRTFGGWTVRALGEFAVVVLGVLVALTADSWWQDREVRARQATYLQMLLTDLERTTQTLEDWLRRNAATIEESRQVADVLVSGDSWDDLPTSVDPRFSYDDMWFSMGTIDALINTGALNHVRSDALRSAIVSYAGEVGYVQGLLNRTQIAIFENFGDYLRAERALVQTEGTPEVRRTAGGSAGPAVLRRFDIDVVRRYPDLGAAYLMHAIILANRNEALVRIRGPLQNLLELVQTEVGGPD